MLTKGYKDYIKQLYCFYVKLLDSTLLQFNHLIELLFDHCAPTLIGFTSRLIRIFTSYQQDNWSSILPLAEFAYNNAPNASTGITPFFANKGYHPNITYHPEHDLASLQA